MIFYAWPPNNRPRKCLSHKGFFHTPYCESGVASQVDGGDRGTVASRQSLPDSMIPSNSYEKRRVVLLADLQN